MLVLMAYERCSFDGHVARLSGESTLVVMGVSLGVGCNVTRDILAGVMKRKRWRNSGYLMLYEAVEKERVLEVGNGPLSRLHTFGFICCVEQTSVR